MSSLFDFFNREPRGADEQSSQLKAVEDAYTGAGPLDTILGTIAAELSDFGHGVVEGFRDPHGQAQRMGVRMNNPADVKLEPGARFDPYSKPTPMIPEGTSFEDRLMVMIEDLASPLTTPIQKLGEMTDSVGPRKPSLIEELRARAKEQGAAQESRAAADVESLLRDLGVVDPSLENMGPENFDFTDANPYDQSLPTQSFKVGPGKTYTPKGGGQFIREDAATTRAREQRYLDVIEGATQQLTRSRANRAAEKAMKSKETMGDVANLLAIGTSNVKKDSPVDFSRLGLGDEMAQRMGALPVELQQVLAKSLVENLAAQQGGGKQRTFKDIESLIASLMYERAQKDPTFLNNLLSKADKK